MNSKVLLLVGLQAIKCFNVQFSHKAKISREPESLNRRIHLSTSLTLPLVLPCDRFHNLPALLLCPYKHLIARCLLLLIPKACPSPDLKNYYSSIPEIWIRHSHVSTICLPVFMSYCSGLLFLVY